MFGRLFVGSSVNQGDPQYKVADGELSDISDKFPNADKLAAMRRPADVIKQADLRQK